MSIEVASFECECGTVLSSLEWAGGKRLLVLKCNCGIELQYDLDKLIESFGEPPKLKDGILYAPGPNKVQ